MTHTDHPQLELAPSAGELETIEQQFHRGFQRVLPLIRAVPKEALRPINLHAPVIVTNVLGALPRIRALRPSLAAMPRFDLAELDRLEDYALALGHTCGSRRTAAAPKNEVAELAREQRAARKLLHLAAAALVAAGLMDSSRLRKLHGGRSHQVLAFDVLGLVELFLEGWPSIVDHTAVTRDQLERARLGANRLLAATGKRAVGGPKRSELDLLHRQAFSLLVGCYSEVRAAVLYLRRAQKDGDLIAPSLSARRGKRSPKEPAREQSEDVPVLPAFVSKPPSPFDVN